VAVSVVINVPRTLLDSRALLGRTAQGDRVLRQRGVLLSLGLILRLASSRLRCLVDLVRVATSADCVYCHTDKIGGDREDFRNWCANWQSLVMVTGHHARRQSETSIRNSVDPGLLVSPELQCAAFESFATRSRGHFESDVAAASF